MLSGAQIAAWQKNCTLVQSKLVYDLNHWMMSQMPSNDDIKYQIDEATKDRAPVGTTVESVLADDLANSADEASINEASVAPLSLDNRIPQEFTFFQKKKRADQAFLGPSVAYASKAQVTAFAARIDGAVAVNAKTQRHIIELTVLMSDVARSMTAEVSNSTRKRLRRSKHLFYGCLVGFGVGWFLLFPTGHNLITQIMAFLAR